MAGSAAQRLSGELVGLPTAPDPEAATRVVELAARLAHVAPVLHDVSDGGAAVAITEICIACGVGATIRSEHPFNEDPHRFLVVARPGSVDLPAGLSRLIGMMGGDDIVINDDAVPLTSCRQIWAGSLEQALAG
jgi:phosphoribosylformylglycinamidine synthase